MDRRKATALTQQQKRQQVCLQIQKGSGIITGFDVAILTFNWRNYACHL